MRRLASAAASWPRSEGGALATAFAFFVATRGRGRMSWTKWSHGRVAIGKRLGPGWDQDDLALTTGRRIHRRAGCVSIAPGRRVHRSSDMNRADHPPRRRLHPPPRRLRRHVGDEDGAGRQRRPPRRRSRPRRRDAEDVDRRQRRDHLRVPREEGRRRPVRVGLRRPGRVAEGRQRQGGRQVLRRPDLGVDGRLEGHRQAGRRRARDGGQHSAAARQGRSGDAAWARCRA